MKIQQKAETEWKELTLKEIAQFINGRAFKPSDWETSGKLIIRIQDLTSSITNPNYTTKTFEDKYLVKRGDLLISWSATLDAFIWDKEEGWLNQHIFKVVPKKDFIDKKYLFYFVKKSISLFMKETHGSTMKHITKGKFESIKIPLPFSNGKPDLKTQEQIVAVLEKAEKLKQKQKRQLELYDEYLKSVFYEMFLKEKVKWEEKSLSEVCEIIMGQSPAGSSYNKNKNGMPFFQGKAEFGEKYPKVKYWTTEPSKIAEPDSILMSVRAPVGSVNVCNIKCCIGRGLASIKPKEVINLEYLFSLLQILENKIADLGSGSTFKAINSGQLRNLKIPLPPLPLQQKFAAIVEKVEKLKEKQKKGLEDSEELFNALMQKAFSGGF